MPDLKLKNRIKLSNTRVHSVGGYVFKLLFMIKLNVPISFGSALLFYKLIIFCEGPGSMGKILYFISFLDKNALKQTL